MFAATGLPNGAKWAYVAVVFLVLCADLKVVIHPQIHWLAVAPLILWALLARRAPVVPTPIYRATLAGAAVLVVTLAVFGTTATEPAYAFLQAAKLAVILAVAFPLLCSRPDLIVPAHIGFGVAIVLNALLVLLGMLGFEDLAFISAAEGRWGTLLNLPGSLSRLGLLLLVFAVYLLAHARHVLMAGSVYLASCLLVMVDGSRTSVSLLVLGHIVALGIVIVERRSRALIFLPLLALALWIAISAAISFSQEDMLPSALQRIATAMEDEASLANVDPVREFMNEQALRQAFQAPFMGSGLNTLLIPIQGIPSTVHNTYLQLWAEVSVLAMAGFVLLAFAWLPAVGRTLRALAGLERPLDKAVGYNAFYIALCFPLAALFHPLSTEWTEWLPLIVAYSIWHALQLARARSTAGAKEGLHLAAPRATLPAAVVGRDCFAPGETESRALRLATDLAEMLHSRPGEPQPAPLPDEPTWTVVIGTRNRGAFLRRALESARVASATPPAVIVVDDASDDDTRGVCEEFPNVTYLRNEQRLGPGGSRNRGLDAAGTDFVLILDDDDEILPNALGTAGFLVAQLEGWRDYPVMQFAHGSGRLDADFVTLQFETYFTGVCGGDFIPCFNTGHPDFRTLRYPTVIIGAEHLLWWEIADRWGIPTWSVCIGVVNHDAPNRQTSVEAQIRGAQLHAAIGRATLARFGKRLARRAPHAYVARHVAVAVYEVLAGNRLAAWALTRRLWRMQRRGSSLKAACISVAPIPVMRSLLVFYRALPAKLSRP
jgi:hypothetical protein